jgi:hypothetical protein
MGVLLYLFFPVLELFEGVLHIQCEGEEHAGCAAVEGFADRSEPFISALSKYCREIQYPKYSV